MFVDQCPLPKYKHLLKIFEYENKNIYSAFSLLGSSNITSAQRQQAVQFLTALELVNLGFSLHHSIGSNSCMNFRITKIKFCDKNCIENAVQASQR